MIVFEQVLSHHNIEMQLDCLICIKMAAELVIPVKISMDIFNWPNSY